MQCSECQSGEKFKPTRENGGRSHDSLKVASALTVKVMEIQTSVAPSEIWLRDDLENIYSLLFRCFFSSVACFCVAFCVKPYAGDS